MEVVVVVVRVPWEEGEGSVVGGEVSSFSAEGGVGARREQPSVSFATPKWRVVPSNSEISPEAGLGSGGFGWFCSSGCSLMVFGLNLRINSVAPNFAVVWSYLSSKSPVRISVSNQAPGTRGWYGSMFDFEGSGVSPIVWSTQAFVMTGVLRLLDDLAIYVACSTSSAFSAGKSFPCRPVSGEVLVDI